jgi:glycosyltransferase involved in cell wall biosynthesis
MRIVQLTSVHQWNDVRIFVKMCRSLARDGHEVHMVAPRENAPERELVDGVNVHAVPMPRNRLERIRRTARAVAARAESLQGDLYHFHDPELIRLMLDAQERTGRPAIYDVHEDYRDQIQTKKWLPPGSRKLVSWLFGRVEDRCTPRLAAVVCTSPHIARRFRSNPALTVIQDYPVLEEFLVEETAPEERIPGRFVFIGEITAIRGIREIVEALPAAGPSARLALGGSWEDSRFRGKVAATPGWRQVEELGYLPREAVKRELARAAAGLIFYAPLPNHYFSQPTKLFECMAAGLPLLVSDFPYWRSIIEEIGCGLLADPTQPEKIAQLMRWVADHPEEAREMGKRGREAARSRFNWAGEYRKLVDLYGRIARR